MTRGYFLKILSVAKNNFRAGGYWAVLIYSVCKEKMAEAMLF